MPSVIDCIVAVVKRILVLLLGSRVMKLISEICHGQGARALVVWTAHPWAGPWFSMGLHPPGEFSKAEAASIEILIQLFSEVLGKYFLKLPKWFCYVTSGLILRPFPWSTDQFWEFSSTCVKCEVIARHPSGRGRVIERPGNYFINIALFLKTLRMNCWAFQGKLKFKKGLKYLLCNVDYWKMGMLSQRRDAPGPLEGVGTRDPTTHPPHPLCLSFLSVSCLSLLLLGPCFLCLLSLW